MGMETGGTVTLTLDLLDSDRREGPRPALEDP